MAAPSVTYTFTNGTTADATQVNTNFTDLISGASDGTKDYTINSASLSGNLSFNGNGTFGSASGDDLTFNGSLASSIPVKANATYDIGGATTGLAGIYFGNNTRTVRLVAGVITSSYAITLPVAVPTKTGMVMTFDASAVGTFRYTNKLTASKTTTYTVTTDETYVPCDATAGAFTVTLPPVSGNSGFQVTIIKTDSSSNAVTVDGDGSETINGSTSTLLYTQYEALTLICDGTVWLIDSRRTAFVATETWTDNQTNATTSVMLSRVGNQLFVTGVISYTGTSNAAIELTIPAAYTADATAYATVATSDYTIGQLVFLDASIPTSYPGWVRLVGNVNTLRFRFGDTSTGTGQASLGSTNPVTFANGDKVSFNAAWIVSGWAS